MAESTKQSNKTITSTSSTKPSTTAVTSGTPTSTTNTSSDSSEVRVSWPVAPDDIMGLPTLGLDDDDLYSVFEQSFPVITIKAFRLEKTDTNKGSKKGSYEEIPKGCYKFALMNDGGVTINVSNDYGPTTLEEKFKNIAENTFGILGEMKQISQSNRILGAATASGMRNLMSTTEAAGNQLHDQFTNYVGSINSKNNYAQFGKEAAITAGNVLEMFGKALFLGNRIDIPDIWKGSSGGMTANVKIDLRARSVGGFDNGDGTEYEDKIVTPIKILLALSCPLRKTDSENNPGGVTYENPPYLEVYIDKIFESRCCAVKNLNISFDYKDTGYYKNRPYHATVTFQLQDMYSVLVWDNKATNNEAVNVDDEIPSSALLVNRMMDDNNNKSVGFLEYSLLQGSSAVTSSETGSFGTVSSFSQKLGSTNKLISDLVGNEISSITENFDDDWFTANYSFSPTSWESVLSSSSLAGTDFSNSIFDYNSSGGFDIFSSLANDVGSLTESITNQKFGNFNMDISNINISSITSIPETIGNIFNGNLTEINNYVPKISIGSLTDTISNYIPMLSDSISNNEITDNINKVNDIFDIIYTDL